MKKWIAIVGMCILGAACAHGSGYLYFYRQKIFFERMVVVYTEDAHRTLEEIPIWHKKINTNQTVKVGMITDTHVHPTRYLRGDKRLNAPRYLDYGDKKYITQFVSRMMQFTPQFMLHLGDVIDGTRDPDAVGIQGLQLVQKELQSAGFPLKWAVGNHDLRSVTKEQFVQTLNLDALDQVFDIGDYRFVILDANYNYENLVVGPGQNSYVRGKLHPNTLDWLKAQLKTDKRVYVFVHQGTFLEDLPGDPETVENELYENEEGEELKEENINGVEYFMKQSMVNAQELNDILREYRVDAIFNGHMEARKYQIIDRTTHYSLTGTEKSETFPGSYYEVTITNGKPDVTMYYTSSVDLKKHVLDFETGEDHIYFQRSGQL